MEKQDLIEGLKLYLRNKLTEMEEDVEEAFDDREGLYDERMYDFGHPQDSFDAGWDRGETVGESNGIARALSWIERNE